MRTLARLMSLCVAIVSFSVVAGQPASASPNQFTLFGQAMTQSATDKTIPTLITNPSDWVSPVNYSTGRAYLRMQVTAKPSTKLVKANVCLWRHGSVNFEFETCANAPVMFTATGTYWTDLGTLSSWWKKNGVWDWSQAPDVAQILLKDDATGKILMSSRCGSSCYTGTDLAQHVPISFTGELVVVEGGGSLTPPGTWNGCPSGWGGGCPNVGAPQAPSITGHPAAASVTAGQTATFSVTATGTTPFTYQWRRNGSPIGGATAATYTTPSTTLADDGALFSVDVTNGHGSATSNAALLTVTSGSTGTWWNTSFDYRMPLTSTAAPSAMVDAPLVVAFDGAAALAQAGGSGTFSPNSLRVVEVNAGGSVIDADVPFQFEPSTPGGTSGQLVVIAQGTTAANSQRRYQVYFDDTASGHGAASPEQLVSTVDGALDQGFTNWRTTTSGGTWVYHRQGGGFAHLYDSANQDWISYSTATGAAGDYRGIPNMVHPADGGHFHPGRTSVTSTLVANGPARTVIESTAAGGAWKVRWEIYPRYAEMSTLAVGGNHWFLYEGTPGGSIGAEDVSIRSNGTVTPLSTSWSGDLASPEWVLFADQDDNRSLLVAQRVNDSIVDSYSLLGGVMTVFGFGRNGTARHLTGTGREFVVALTQGDTVGTTAGAVASSLAVVDAGLGPAEPRGGGGGGGSGLVSDQFSSAPLAGHWTENDPAGDTGVSIANGRLNLSVPAGVVHDLWGTQLNATRITQAAANTDFTVEAVFVAAPASKLQVEGIVVESASGDLLRFDLLRGASLQTFAGHVSASSSTELHRAAHSGSGTVRIRVIRSGDQWTMEVARGAGAYSTVASFTRAIVVSKVGVWAGNGSSPTPAFISRVDAFNVS